MNLFGHFEICAKADAFCGILNAHYTVLFRCVRVYFNAQNAFPLQWISKPETNE